MLDLAMYFKVVRLILLKIRKKTNQKWTYKESS